MNQIIASAAARIPAHWEPNTSYAVTDYMTESERQEHHDLQMRLPSFGDLAEHARKRLAEKRWRRLQEAV